MLPKEPSKTSALLDKFASLTTIRDIDLFEFSFMQTLAEMLEVDEISFYKFNSHNAPSSLISYSSDEQSDGFSVLSTENIVVPDEIKHAQEWINSTKKVFTSQKDKKYTTIFPVLGSQSSLAYLSISLNHELSEAENLVVSSLLSISQNFHGLLEENQKDKLTGLLNRKTFDDNIAKIQNILNSGSDKSYDYSGDEKRHDKGGQYWLSIIDIDHFKKINDTFGHVYGDEVLLMLSQVMKNTFRPDDLLFRFGGEEFIVIINVESQQKAAHAFERFRLAIEEFRFPQVGQVTISLGATLIHEQHAIASDIVGRADEALYYAKEHGRNKLFFYEELLAKGIFTEKVEDGDVELF